MHFALIGHAGVHQSGRFVIVSNRGHESVTVLRVKQGCSSKEKATRGTLTQVGFFHTRGETPRHFQFDHSGQFLIVANQDSDSIAVFSFNLTSGEITYTGHDVSLWCVIIFFAYQIIGYLICLFLIISTASRVQTLFAAVQQLADTQMFLSQMFYPYLH
jgi:hypothetical protein